MQYSGRILDYQLPLRLYLVFAPQGGRREAVDTCSRPRPKAARHMFSEAPYKEPRKAADPTHCGAQRVGPAPSCGDDLAPLFMAFGARCPI